MPSGTLPRPIRQATALLFGHLAALRQKRSLHPRGVTLAGTASMLPAGSPLAEDAQVPALVRFSRGIGLRHPLPDFNGVAVRLIDGHGPGRHQDLLLASAGTSPVLRHVLVPAPWIGSSSFSTILPYETEVGSRVFGCDPPPARALEDLERSLPFDLELRIAPALGRWQGAATLRLESIVEHDEDIRFDPWNTGPGLRPAGLLNRLRRPAYAGSRAGAPPG